MKRHGMAAAILSLAVLLAACSPASEPVSGEPSAVSWDSLTVESGLDLQYADQFTVDYYTGGYALIHIVDGNDYLVVPENKPVPDGLADTTVVLTQPLDHIYLVATSAMDLFCALDGIGSIRCPAQTKEAGILMRPKPQCKTERCCTPANTVRRIMN